MKNERREAKAVTIYGIECTVEKEKFPDGWHNTYRFTAAVDMEAYYREDEVFFDIDR